MFMPQHMHGLARAAPAWHTCKAKLVPTLQHPTLVRHDDVPVAPFPAGWRRNILTRDRDDGSAPLHRHGRLPEVCQVTVDFVVQIERLVWGGSFNGTGEM